MSISTENLECTASVMGHLRPGDVIEARQLDGPDLYRGEIEDIVHKQGILWILHGPLKIRKLIEASGYELLKCPAGQ